MLTPAISIRGSRALFAAILFFGLLAMTARPATDPDLWWHLRTGQRIVETGHVPHTDPFSFTRGGSSWVSHEWLSEVIFYALWKLGGPGAGPIILIVFSSLLTTAGFLLLDWRCPGEPHWAAAATVLGAWASAPCWGTRPQTFTFLLASIFLWLLDRAGPERTNDRPRLLLWIPPLFLLWLNLHAGFALGPVLMFLYAAGVVLEAANGTTPWPQARPIVTRIFLAILACLALVPLNPSGARLYLYPLETVRASELRSLILEWHSPDFHHWMYFPCLLVFLLLIVALSRSRSPIRGRILLPLAFMFLSALDAARHIPIFILLAIPAIARWLSQLSSAPPVPAVRPPQRRFLLFFNWATLLLLAVFALARWNNLARTQNLREAQQYPNQAVAFLRASNPFLHTGNPDQPGRLFAYYDWGGYAIWKLYPQYRVFVDGRSDLYGDQILKQAETAVQLHDDWRAVLAEWRVQTILIPPNSALAQALLLDPGWNAPYHDSQASVFVRNRLSGASYPPPRLPSGPGTIVKTTIN
ncbi:MAG: hypothetical protein WA172_06010 [Terriglobales bacterium]